MKIDIFSIFIGAVLVLLLTQLKTCTYTRHLFPQSNLFSISENDCESQYFNTISIDTQQVVRTVYLQPKDKIVTKEVIVHDTTEVIVYRDRTINMGKKTYKTEQYHNDVGLEIISSDEITIENNTLTGHIQKLTMLDTIPVSFTEKKEVKYFTEESPFSFAIGTQTSLQELQLKPSLDLRYQQHGFEYNYDVFNKEHSIGYKFWINGRKITKQIK